MSDESTTPPVASEAVTAPLPNSAEQPLTATAAPQQSPEAAPAENPARSNAGVYVFAVSAAIVLALGLSAVSFGAGVFVGRVSGARGGIAAGGPAAGVPGQPMMPQGDFRGSGEWQGRSDDERSGAGQGRGGMRGGFPGHPGGQGAPTAPNGQSAPVPNAQ
jgi:hypothetical protein